MERANLAAVRVTVGRAARLCLKRSRFILAMADQTIAPTAFEREAPPHLDMLTA